MVLLSLVIMTVQQHKSIQLKIEESKNLLAAISDEIVSDALSAEHFGISRYLEGNTWIHSEKDACLTWSIGDFSQSIPESCRHPQDIRHFLAQAAASKRQQIFLEGSVWALFTYASENLIISAPLVWNGEVVGSVAISRSLLPLYHSLRAELQIILVYLLANAIIFASIGLFRLMQLVVHPIEKLVAVAERYKADEGVNFLLGKSTGEFGKLTTSLNEMLQRIENDNRKLRHTVESLEKANKELEVNRQGMVQTEKLAAVGRLSAGLAHEIGNPLGIVQGYVDMLGKVELTGEEKEQFARRAGHELQRINALIRQLLDYARTSSEHFAKIAVHELIRDVIELLPARKKAETFSLITSLDAEVDTVFAVGDRLRQVFLNCLLNAIDAIESSEIGQGEIVISTRNAMDDKGNALLEVLFSDNGIGIPPEHLAIVFDPFFTTKAPGKGTGLGLAVSYAIIENFGGKISVARRSAGGTEVLVSLPMIDNSI